MIAPKPIHIVNAGLLAVLAWACWGIYASPPRRPRAGKAAGAQAGVAAAAAEPGHPPREHYAVIEQANIFKNKDIVAKPPEPPPPPPTPVPLPPIEEKVSITGTMVMPGDPKMKVIINFKQGGKGPRSSLYGINDVVPDTDGARIVEITKNSVVFERQGERLTLELRPPAVEPPGGPPAGPQAAQRRDGKARPGAEPRHGRPARAPGEQRWGTAARSLRR